jgi:predicted ribosome-associated RNA-binding protein Tma20
LVLEGKPSIYCSKLANRTIVFTAGTVRWIQYNTPNTGSTNFALYKYLLLAEGDIPLFFDVDGRNILYPTIFTLWKFPSLLPHVKIPSPVSSFLLRGADLMAPGVINLPGEEYLN